MTSPSHDELIQRTARRVGVTTTQVERIIDTYADEYIQLDRKMRLDTARRTHRETSLTTEFAAPGEAPVTPETAQVTPRKRTAKVTAAAKPSDAQAPDTTT